MITVEVEVTSTLDVCSTKGSDVSTLTPED